jgi:16S rRNA (cytosine967-C5)-methyltransferase
VKVTYKNVEAVVQIAHDIIVKNLFSDKVFESTFKHPNDFTTQEKAFIVEHVYHLIRNWRLFSEIQLQIHPSGQYSPETLVGIGWVINGLKLPQWEIFKSIDEGAIRKLYKEFKGNRAVFYSIPDWLDKRGETCLLQQWPAILKSLHKEPHMVVRVNTHKTSRDKLRQLWANKGIKTEIHPETPNALIFLEKINVFKLPEFKEGLFEMQDISSQLTSHFVNPQPGMRIIDGCAGNGGKTLHLANLMQNKGKIIALDLFASKLETLKKRAKRAGSLIIETREISSTKIIKRLYDSADIVLLDVPCSGLGVLKRNPEIKYRLQHCDLENLKKTQEDILLRYSRMVKPGGTLVYSTCSILPSENTGQIHSFLEGKKEAFEFIEERFISPEEGFDGFYMAKMRRK